MSLLSDADTGELRDYSPAEVLNDMQMHGCKRSMSSAQGLSLSIILFGCIRSHTDALYVIDIASKLLISKDIPSANVTTVYRDAMP